MCMIIFCNDFVSIVFTVYYCIKIFFESSNFYYKGNTSILVWDQDTIVMTTLLFLFASKYTDPHFTNSFTVQPVNYTPKQTCYVWQLHKCLKPLSQVSDIHWPLTVSLKIC